MARKIVFLFLLLASCFFVFGYAGASVSDDINLTNLKIDKTVLQPGEEINGAVIVVNSGKEVVGGLTFYFELLAGKEVNNLLTVVEKRLDSKKMAETFTLNAGDKVLKNFSYTLPQNLPDGNVFLSVRLTNSRGERMMWIEKKIEIKGNNNFLLLSNGLILLKSGAKIPPAVGVNIDAGDETKIQFDIENISSGNQTIYPEIKTYKRNADDANLVRKEKGDSIILAPKEKKPRIIALPSLMASDSYYTEVKYYDEKNNEPISNALYFRWTVNGPDIAKILSVSADKTTYQIGETANILVKTSGPSGNFKFDPKNVPSGVLSLKLFDGQGRLAGEKKTDIILGAAEMNIEVPINKYVANPKIEAIISKGQNILDNYSVKIDSDRIEPNETKSRVVVLIAAIIVILMAFAGIFLAIWKQKARFLGGKKGGKTTIEIRIKRKIPKDKLIFYFYIIFWSVLVLALVSLLCFLFFGKGWVDILNIINGNPQNNSSSGKNTAVIVAGDSGGGRPLGKSLPYWLKSSLVTVERDLGFGWPLTIGQDGCIENAFLLDQTNSLVKLTDPSGSSPLVFAPDQTVCFQAETSSLSNSGGLLYDRYTLFSAPDNDQAHSRINVALGLRAPNCMGARSCWIWGGAACCADWVANNGLLPISGCQGESPSSSFYCYRTMVSGGGGSDDYLSSDDWGACPPHVPRVLDENNNLLTLLPSSAPLDSWDAPYGIDGSVYSGSYYVMDAVNDVARLTACLTETVGIVPTPKDPPFSSEVSLIPGGESRIYFQYSGVNDSLNMTGLNPLLTPEMGPHSHWQIGYMPVSVGYKPTQPNPTFNFDYCADAPGEGELKVSWVYEHAGFLSQTNYKILLAVFEDTAGNNVSANYEYNIEQSLLPGATGSSTIKIDETENYGAETPAVNTFLPTLGYNAKYNLKVALQDSAGYWSSSDGYTFTTPVSPFPAPFFSYAPSTAVLGQEVNFTNNVQFFDSVCSANPNNPSCSYQWVFEDGTPILSNNANPSAIFNASGNKEVVLTITDSNSNSCASAQTIDVSALAPHAVIKCRDLSDVSDLPIVNGHCQGFQNDIKFLNNSVDYAPGGEITSSDWFIKEDDGSSSYSPLASASCDAGSPGGVLCSFVPSSLGLGNWIAKLSVADNNSLTGTAEQHIYVKKDVSAGFMCSMNEPGDPETCTGPWFNCNASDFFIENPDKILCIKDDLVLPVHSEPSEGGSLIQQRSWTKNGIAMPVWLNTDSFSFIVGASDIAAGNIALNLEVIDDNGRATDITQNIKTGAQYKYKPQWWETAPF